MAKSKAQLEREIDAVGRELSDDEIDPRDGYPLDVRDPRVVPKRQIPGIAGWNTFAGGTGAAPSKRSYSILVPEGEYHVSPVSSQHGRHRGYTLTFSATRQRPHGGHGGLWHELGMHRSPAQAAVVARAHYAASY